jgi:hypothetical protein
MPNHAITDLEGRVHVGRFTLSKTIPATPSIRPTPKMIDAAVALPKGTKRFKARTKPVRSVKPHHRLIRQWTSELSPAFVEIAPDIHRPYAMARQVVRHHVARTSAVPWTSSLASI